MTARKSSRVPSGALTASAGMGGSIGALLEIGAAAFGVPLPPGSGAALAAVATGVVHYLQGHGRKTAAPGS